MTKMTTSHSVLLKWVQVLMNLSYCVIDTIKYLFVNGTENMILVWTSPSVLVRTSTLEKFTQTSINSH